MRNSKIQWLSFQLLKLLNVTLWESLNNLTMNRLPTKNVEEIYSILQKYAEASANYYDREGFIYSFGVISNPPKKFKLRCMDDSPRFFIKSDNEYLITGKGSNRINPMISSIIQNGNSIAK